VSAAAILVVGRLVRAHDVGARSDGVGDVRGLGAPRGTHLVEEQSTMSALALGPALLELGHGFVKERAGPRDGGVGLRLGDVHTMKHAHAVRPVWKGGRLPSRVARLVFKAPDR